MPRTLAAQLNKFADADLRAARKHGEMLIGQTKRGTVALRYAGGIYTLTLQGPKPEILVSGMPGMVRPILAALYDVERHPTVEKKIPDLRRALAWARDGYSHRLYIIGVEERDLYDRGLIDSHGEITNAGRAILERD